MEGLETSGTSEHETHEMETIMGRRLGLVAQSHTLTAGFEGLGYICATLQERSDHSG